MNKLLPFGRIGSSPREWFNIALQVAPQSCGLDLRSTHVYIERHQKKSVEG